MKEAIVGFLRLLIEAIDGEQISEYQREFAIQAGQILADERVRSNHRHAECSHRKGGLIHSLTNARSIAAGLNNGMSDSYSVRKHQMMNGDIWVDCLRCGKKWRPPVKQTFNWFERKFRTERFKAYVAALVEYDRATHFPTNNVMSGSVLCAFYDPKTGKRADDQVRAMYEAIGE